MIDLNRKLRNFGPLEALVISSIIYVIVMLLWTASTRSEVLQKANDIKSNHKSVVDFMNDEVNNELTDIEDNKVELKKFPTPPKGKSIKEVNVIINIDNDNQNH